MAGGSDPFAGFVPKAVDSGFEAIDAILSAKHRAEQNALDLFHTAQDDWGNTQKQKQRSDLLQKQDNEQLQAYIERIKARQAADHHDRKQRSAFQQAGQMQKQAGADIGGPPSPPTLPQEVPVGTPNYGAVSQLSTAVQNLGDAGAAASGGAAVQQVGPYTLNNPAPVNPAPSTMPPISTAVPIMGPAGAGGGAFALPQRAPLPDTPALTANLNVSSRTAPTQVGTMNYYPMTTTDRSISVAPNVLSAAQKATLEEQRYQYDNDYRLNVGKWRADALVNLGNTYGGAAASQIVQQVGQNGEISPELASRLKTMTEYNTEDMSRRTNILDRTMQLNEAIAKSDSTHKTNMERLQAGHLTLEGLQSDRDTTIRSAMGVIEYGKMVGDQFLVAQGQKLQQYGIQMNAALGMNDTAARVYLGRLDQEMGNIREVLRQRMDNYRQQVDWGNRLRMASDDRAQQILMEGMHRDTSLALLDRENRNRLQQMEAGYDYDAGDFFHTGRIPLENNLRLETSLKLLREGKMDDAAIADQAHRYSLANTVTEANARLQAEAIRSETLQRVEELRQQGIAGDQAVKIAVNEAAIQRDQTLGRIRMLGAVNNLSDSALKLLSTREALDARSKTVTDSIAGLQQAGKLDPNSFTTGQMMGFRPADQIAKRDPATALAKIMSGGAAGNLWGGAKTVDPNADPAIFYEAAVPAAVSGDKILALNKDNGVTYLDGKMVAGMWATARGLVAGSGPEQVKAAGKWLEDNRLGEVRGGQLVPYHKGVTTAWANAYADAFDKNILPNMPYLMSGAQQAGRALGYNPLGIRGRDGNVYTAAPAQVAPSAPAQDWRSKLNSAYAGETGDRMIETINRLLSMPVPGETLNGAESGVPTLMDESAVPQGTAPPPAAPPPPAETQLPPGVPRGIWR